MTTQPVERRLSSNPYQEMQQSLLTPALWALSAVVAAAALASLPANLRSGNWLAEGLLVACGGWLAAAAWLKWLDYTRRAGSILAVLFILGAYALVSQTGPQGGELLLTGFICAAFLFFNVRLGLIASTISVATVLLIGGLSLASQQDLEPASLSRSLTAFVTSSVTFILVIFALAALLALFIAKIESLVSRYAGQAAHGQEKMTYLEAVARQAQEEANLSRHAFDISHQLGQQLAIDAAPEAILRRAVNYLRSEFDFYFVGVFEPDAEKEFALLKAGTGSEGASLLAQGYRISLHQSSLLSAAYKNAGLRLAASRHENIDFLENPVLTKANAELVLPLVANQEVIGLLDIASARTAAFSQEDLQVLQACAGQLAAVYENAVLKTRLTQALRELDSTHQQFTQTSWKARLGINRRKYSFRLKENSLEVEDRQPLEVRQAISQGQAVITSGPSVSSGGSAKTSLAIPIQLRGLPIGAIHVNLDRGNVPGDLQELIETISDRLAVALENARLLENVQERAEREHLVSEISNRIRSSPDIEQVLRTAVAELGQTLGAEAVTIQLQPEEEIQ